MSPRARTRMSKRIMALAAVLLACGIGTASAQGQTQIQGQAQPQGQTQVQMPGQGSIPGSGQARTAIPPYSEQIPDTKPLQSHVGQPRVNPSAAGTVREQDKDASQAKTGGDSGEHSGSVGSNANTHPLKSLRAGSKPRQEGMTEPSGVYPPPHSTMNRDAGR